jgi:plasmid stabilization system protein ParE
MAKEIRWTKAALKDLDRIEGYIRENFGRKSAIKFLDELESVMNSVSMFPGIGTLIMEEENVRGILIHRLTRVYYKDEDKIIILLRLFETYRSTDNINLD